MRGGTAEKATSITQGQRKSLTWPILQGSLKRGSPKWATERKNQTLCGARRRHKREGRHAWEGWYFSATILLAPGGTTCVPPGATAYHRKRNCTDASSQGLSSRLVTGGAKRMGTARGNLLDKSTGGALNGA